MSKYIDKDKALEYIIFGVVGKEITCGELTRAIESLPTIDIVSCKDCKWSKPNREGDYDCKCHIPIFRVPEDGWCYLGERIEE